MTRVGLLLVLITFIVGLPLESQTPRFEVASVKPNTSGEIRQSSQIGNGSLTLTNMRVRAMLVLAFGIMQPERIVGLPPWTERERFDVAAKAPPNTPDDQLRLMLRTLLAERFRLIAHAEMREQPVYALVIARAGAVLGPNLKLSTACNASGGGRGAANAALPVGNRACSVITRSDGPGAASERRQSDYRKQLDRAEHHVAGGSELKASHGNQDEKQREASHADVQFSAGRSADVMTTTSSGAVDGSSLRPSCSCTAVNTETPSASGVGAHSSSKSKVPVSPVRSTTGRSAI